MIIRILHIDDQADVRDRVRAVVSGTEMGEFTLEISDSCDFTEGMDKLMVNQYDLVILDLCIGEPAEGSEKIGEQIFNQIKERAFIPVLFFTGLPEHVADLESDIVKVAAKGDSYDALFAQTEAILQTGFIKIKRAVDDIIREGVRSYFWNFVHPHGETIQKIKEDEVSLKYLLLRRLAKTLSSETLKATIEDAQIKKDLSHPMEFYIYPAVDGEFETGDILKHKQTGVHSVILTPACDLIQRANGKRKADKILIVDGSEFKSTSDYLKLGELRTTRSALIEEMAKSSGKQTEQLQAQVKKAEDQISNVIGKLKDRMKPKDDRYFFLPQTPFLPALLLDFQHKSTITYEQLETDFEVVATLDDPFTQSMQSSFIRYYNRVGFPDLDVDYAFEKIA